MIGGLFGVKCVVDRIEITMFRRCVVEEECVGEEGGVWQARTGDMERKPIFHAAKT